MEERIPQLRDFCFMYYIYILYSSSADIYYIGYTNDYERRLNEHNRQNSFNTFTSKHRPWLLKAAFQCGDSEKAAIQIERFIKKQKSRAFIEQILKAEKVTGLWLSWLESRNFGINQRVFGSSPKGGANIKQLRKWLLLIFKTSNANTQQPDSKEELLPCWN
jgi:putative endonuclease